jgi:O-antigen/teichoic acid export membrane protein
MPRLLGARIWLSEHSDLGVRYLLEGTSSSVVMQVRGYGTGLILGLAAVGYVQASVTLMGPMTILSLGMGLVTIPEGARVLRRAPHRLPLFCVLVSVGLAVAGLFWGLALLFLVPRGLGHWLLHNNWRSAYPLVFPQMLYVIASGLATGAGVGLHSLGAARRSLRVVLLSALIASITILVGALVAGAPGTIYGMAAGSCIGVVMLWTQFRKALHEYNNPSAEDIDSRMRHGRHRKVSNPGEAQ